MFLLNTNNYFRVRVRFRVRFRVRIRFRVRVSILLNTFTPQFSVGEPAVRINSDIVVSAKLQLYRGMPPDPLGIPHASQPHPPPPCKPVWKLMSDVGSSQQCMHVCEQVNITSILSNYILYITGISCIWTDETVLLEYS